MIVNLAETESHRQMNQTGVIVLLLILLLIVAGCDYTSSKLNQLMQEIQQGNLASVQTYLQDGGNPNAKAGGKTLLRISMEAKNKDAYKLLLDSGADPDQVSSDGHTVTGRAANTDESLWLEYALEAGADPDGFNSAKGLAYGNPLYFAIIDNQIDNVKLLMLHNADISVACDINGSTPLTLSCSRRSFEIMYLLLENEADYLFPSRKSYSFILHFQFTYPDEFTSVDSEYEWCLKAWEWFEKKGLDPKNATWDGTKWNIPQLQQEGLKE